MEHQDAVSEGQKPPAAEAIHFLIIVAGRSPIPEKGMPHEILRTVIDRAFQENNVPIPPNIPRREVVWESHGGGPPQRSTVDESRTLSQIGIGNGDHIAVSWPAVNG